MSEKINENRIVVAGKVYRAAEASNGCTGCVFNHGGVTYHDCDVRIPSCFSSHRKDNTGIIWREELPPVLDVCCGSRMFWFDKDDKRALFMDKRTMPPTKMSNGATINVTPDIVADFRDMPFPDNSFQVVIFDPPHAVRAGEKSFVFKKYGCLGKYWREDLRKGFSECFRVLKPGGTLIFKWNDMHQPISEILKLTPEKPLVGNRNRAGKTHWVVFIKDCEER